MCVICCISSNRVKAQSEDYFTNTYWIDFIPHARISNAFEFYGDVSLRSTDNGNQQIYTIRPSIKYQAFPAVSFHIGIGLFYYNNLDTTNVLETRPWEGIRIGWPNIGRFKFKQYFRLEQRYFDYIDDSYVLFYNRGRFLSQVKIPLNKKTIEPGAFYIPLGFEWLATTEQDLKIIWASQTRLIAGLGYILNDKWQIDFEYMYWWEKETPSDNLEPSNQIFRLKIQKNGWVSGE